MNRREYLKKQNIHNIVSNFFLEENQQRYVEFTPHSKMNLVSIVPYVEKVLIGVYRLAELPEKTAMYEYLFHHPLDNTLWGFGCQKGGNSIQVTERENPITTEFSPRAVLLSCIDIKNLYDLDSQELKTFMCSVTGVVTNLIRDYNDHTLYKCEEILNKRKR